MNYQDYIKTELLILVPVLYFLGIGLKKSKIKDNLIPIILGLIGILMSAIWVIATSDVSGVKEILLSIFTATTQGILIAGTSVYANQIFIQSKKKE